MSEEKRKKEIRNFKILIIIVALFSALFPLYQCAQELKMTGKDTAHISPQNSSTKGQTKTTSH